MIKVAVRDETGITHVFKVAPEDAVTHEDARALVQAEFPKATAIIAIVGVV